MVLLDTLGKLQKKQNYFLNSSAIKASTPPPSSLMAGFFSTHKKTVKKIYFFLNGKRITPLLMALKLRKELIFAASLRDIQ